MDRSNVGAVGGAAAVLDAVIQRQPRGFQCAVAGSVALQYEDGTSVIWPSCAAGVIHAHFGFVKVLTAGTTATGIIVAY